MTYDDLCRYAYTSTQLHWHGLYFAVSSPSSHLYTHHMGKLGLHNLSQVLLKRWVAYLFFPILLQEKSIRKLLGWTKLGTQMVPQSRSFWIGRSSLVSSAGAIEGMGYSCHLSIPCPTWSPKSIWGFHSQTWTWSGIHTTPRFRCSSPWVLPIKSCERWI